MPAPISVGGHTFSPKLLREGPLGFTMQPTGSSVVMEGAVLLFLKLAFLIAAPTTVVLPPPPVAEPSPPPVFVSELARAGIKPALFDRPVKPKADVVAMFSTDDYPLDALRKSEAGTVAVALKIGADGRVTDCVVTGSSGSASLDAQTCRILYSGSALDSFPPKTLVAGRSRAPCNSGSNGSCRRMIPRCRSRPGP